MVYGILLESVMQCFILEKYDRILLEQIEEYVQHPLSHINLFDTYDDRLMIAIAEGMMSYPSISAVVPMNKRKEREREKRDLIKTIK